MSVDLRERPFPIENITMSSNVCIVFKECLSVEYRMPSGLTASLGIYGKIKVAAQ